jgi:hypothetical protein
LAVDVNKDLPDRLNDRLIVSGRTSPVHIHLLLLSIPDKGPICNRLLETKKTIKYPLLPY